MKDNPAGTRRCKDVGSRLIFGRDQSDVVKTLESGWFLVATNPTKIRRLENFHFQPDSNVNPTSELNVIPTSYWRQMSAGLIKALRKKNHYSWDSNSRPHG